MIVTDVPHMSLSWLVNVLDGIVLIVAHVISGGPSDPNHSLYRFLYHSKYIYTVWTLEVHEYT